MEEQGLTSIFDIVNIPIGYLMGWICQFVGNYGLAVIVLAIIARLCMLPLGIKQHKGQLSQMKFAPRIRRIQEKYGDDQQKMQQEMQKLQAEGYSPAAGCGSLLIQFPILIGIYNVIRSPLQYVFHLGTEAITDLAQVFGVDAAANGYQIDLLNKIVSEGKTAELITNGAGSWVGSWGLGNLELFGLNISEFPQRLDWGGFLGGLIPIPSFVDWLWIIPVLSALTAIASTVLTQKLGPGKYMQDPAQQQKSTGFLLNFLGPYMSYSIAFSVPAGLGLYWISSNVLMAAQTFLLNKVYNPAVYKKKFEEEEARNNLLRKKKKAIAAKLAAQETISEAKASENKEDNGNEA